MYKIFIVEDDEIIAQTIARRMNAWGCEARVATNFENVTAEFADFDPQLVLMDISLPFFNGY
ncbi:MAG: response regulator, partial [Oscillospiraceae bacterium]